MHGETIPYYLVDVFTDRRFGGNQLAVFIDLENRLDHDEMLNMARELNLAEVTFIKAAKADHRFHVRIFTTEYEVPFAGHPSLGTAYIIAQHLVTDPVAEIILEVEAGDIPIRITDPLDLSKSKFIMEQVQPTFFDTYDMMDIAQTLHIDKDALDPNWCIQRVSTGLHYIIVPMLSLKAVESLKLDDNATIHWLKEQKQHKTNSKTGRSTSFLFITKETLDPTNDYHVRMFCIEAERLVEDAATGSANGCLLAYLLQYHLPTIEATIEQGSEMGRPSILLLSGRKEDERYSIQVGGQVVPIAEGQWYV